MTTTNYQQQAIDFLTKTNTSFSVKYLRTGKYFDDDKEERDIYNITLSRNGKRVSFRFGQSINDTVSKEVPTAYDLLSCLQKYEIGSFEEFCSEFGYEAFNDEYTGRNKASYRTYLAVQSEWSKVHNFFTDDELTELQEIN